MSTRATKEKTGAEPRTKNRTLALALGGRATVAGWLGYGIGYYISRVEISPGIYIYSTKINTPSINISWWVLMNTNWVMEVSVPFL